MKDCGELFDYEDMPTAKEYMGECHGVDSFGEYKVCPNCGTTGEYEEVKACDKCGEMVCEEDLIKYGERNKGTICFGCLDSMFSIDLGIAYCEAYGIDDAPNKASIECFGVYALTKLKDLCYEDIEHFASWLIDIEETVAIS